MAQSQIIGLDKLHKRIDNFSRKAPGVDRAIVNDIALATKTIMLAAAEADAPGRRLSQFARGRGAKLNVSYNVRTHGTSASALVMPTPPGPWYLLEKGAEHPYQISARGQRNRFLGSAARGFAASGTVTHPAMRGKDTWSKGAHRALAAGAATFRRSASHRYINLLKG